MKHATKADLKEIYGHLQKRKDVFPHVRQDKLRRMIEAGQVVWQDGVVITTSGTGSALAWATCRFRRVDHAAPNPELKAVQR